MSRATGGLLSAAALGVLAGCAVGPNFHRPPPPVVSAYTPPSAAVPLSIGPQTLVAGADLQWGWWRAFRSQALDALVEQSLKANSDLEAARFALKAARETYLAQRGTLLPQVDASTGATRNKSSEYLSPPTINNNVFYYTLDTAQLSISYTLDLFGGLRREVENTRALEDNQRFQTEGVYLTLVSNVVATAVEEASLRDQVAAQKDVIALETRMLAIMRRQLELGQIGRSDVLAQETAVAEAEAALPPLQKQLATTRDQLAYLVGRAPGEGDLKGLDLGDLTLPADLPLSLPSKLVEHRPDVRAAEANLHAASAAVGVAVAARLPTLTLSASAGGNNGQWSNLLSQPNTFWSYGAGVAQPIFQGGTLLHKQKAAEAQLDQAKALYRSAVLAAFQNVSDTLQALAVDEHALQTAEAAERAARSSFDIAMRQAELGQIAGLQVLNAEQALSAAELALVQARAARFADTAALFQALGGGWWNDGPKL
jgi:NodT family efflux transporter outer membrane factor (OMF) lipoprotein